jgi:hypothetical protein
MCGTHLVPDTFVCLIDFSSRDSAIVLQELLDNIDHRDNKVYYKNTEVKSYAPFDYTSYQGIIKHECEHFIVFNFSGQKCCSAYNFWCSFWLWNMLKMGQDDNVVFQQTIGISMDTNWASLLCDVFLHV